MAEQAEKARKSANAANRRAELLGNAKDKKDEVYMDTDVAAVLNEVEEAEKAPAPDLPDKL